MPKNRKIHCIKTVLPSIGNVLKALAKRVLILVRLIAAASGRGAANHKKRLYLAWRI